MTPEQQQLAISLLKHTLEILEITGNTELFLYQDTKNLLKQVEGK